MFGKRKSAPRRPRLLVMNQYYSPGVEATAHLLGDLCSHLSEHFDITVVTGLLQHPDVDAGSIVVDGVRVIRVRSTRFDRTGLAKRGANYLSYLAQSLRVGLTVSRPDAVLCMTDPPIIGDVGLLIARRFRVPLVVISQDVFPEIAVQLRRLENPLLVGVLRWLIAYYLQRADRVVAIGETMADRLVEKGAPRDRITVIPNWVDTGAIGPVAKANPWSVENGLADKFVVMHSGNVGHAQNLDALVRAATFLRDIDDLVIAIIGTGARRASLLELASVLETDKVHFLPYQPREVLSQSLSAGDVHVVGLAPGLSGYVVPSRLYGILSAGRPVIAAAEATSETARLVGRVGCGVVVRPGRPELLAAAIRDAYDGAIDLPTMGSRAREYVLAEADRSVAVERYTSLLNEVVA
ncbi:MAG TPA: glycosyltransferase family 4 protein [Gaiellaceae bacterium]